MEEKIWLSSPHLGGKELEYIHDAFENNWIAPLGPNVDGFEEDLTQFLGGGNIAALSSGTAAIHLALVLSGVEQGDEVLCQSMTFAASANPITYQGAKPVFIDSEPDTWNMDPKLLEAAINDRIKKTGEKPKAIIAVHLYGMPAKIAEIKRIAEEYEIPLIEDAAESLGSHINNEMTGTWGDFGTFSFNGNKIITTSGGGALFAEQKDIIKKARFLATQARDEAPHYQHSHVGYNYRMSNISAGIGRGQMEILNKRISQKRAVHQYYFDELGKTWLKLTSSEGVTDGMWKVANTSDTGIYFLKEPEGYFSNRWLTTIVIDPKSAVFESREEVREMLIKNNIDCRPLWKPMHLQPIFKEAPFYGNGLSEYLFQNGLCIPSGSNLNKKELKKIVSLIKSRAK